MCVKLVDITDERNEEEEVSNEFITLEDVNEKF